MFFFYLVLAMPLCASVYMCFVVTCWERADLLLYIVCTDKTVSSEHIMLKNKDDSCF